jgi:hypothetical protein
VTGTRKKIWRSGQYEDHRGFLVLTEVPKKNSTCVLVKLGFNQVKLKCPIEYLYPETTTELDRLVCHEDAVQIDMINCQRVVVIGPSWDGKMEFVGLFGYIVAASHSAYPLQPNQVCVFVYKDGQYLDCVYFHINSICRSHQEHIVWDGLHYQ